MLSWRIRPTWQIAFVLGRETVLRSHPHRSTLLGLWPPASWDERENESCQRQECDAERFVCARFAFGLNWRLPPAVFSWLLR